MESSIQEKEIKQLSGVKSKSKNNVSAPKLNKSGKKLYKNKQYEKALVNYEAALQIKPNYADCLYNKALALASLQRYDEALVSYEAALKGRCRLS